MLEQANQSHQSLQKLELVQEPRHRSQSLLLRMLEQEPHQMLEPVCFQMLELRVPPKQGLQSQSQPMPCYV